MRVAKQRATYSDLPRIEQETIQAREALTAAQERVKALTPPQPIQERVQLQEPRYGPPAPLYEPPDTRTSSWGRVRFFRAGVEVQQDGSPLTEPTPEPTSEQVAEREKARTFNARQRAREVLQSLSD